MNQLNELNSATGKLIVLYISQKAKATVEELRSELDIPLLELYPVLNKLVSKNVLTKTGHDTYSLSA